MMEPVNALDFEHRALASTFSKFVRLMGQYEKEYGDLAGSLYEFPCRLANSHGVKYGLGEREPDAPCAPEYLCFNSAEEMVAFKLKWC